MLAGSAARQGTIKKGAISSAGAQRLEQSAAQLPLGRIGEPDDVAAVVAFFASDAARYISGQTIVVYGGLLVRLGT